MIQEWIAKLSNPDYWKYLLDQFHLLGPLVPVMLAFGEAFLPFLPLIGIITLNISAYGNVMGFFLTWAGSCLGCAVTFHIWRLVGKKFFDKYKTQGGRFEKANKWVSKMKPGVVFTLLLMPFTPSSFVNFVVGLSDFEGVSYMAIMMTAKFGMLMSLALFGDSLVNVGKHPARAVLVAVFMIGLYFASKKLTKKMEEEEEKRILKKEEENNGFR